MVVPAAFGGDSGTVWTDNRNHFDVFVTTIHPMKVKHKRHDIISVLLLCIERNILTPFSH